MSTPPIEVACAPTRAARHSDSALAIVTMCAFSMVGNTVLAVQPMVVGGLVDLLHFSEKQAGFVAGAELLGFSLGGTALLAFVNKVDRRVLTLIGVGIAVFADVAACLVRAFPPMLVVRFLAGVGSVTAYSVFPVLAAASTSPERVFGIVNATSIAYAGLFVWIAPVLLRAWHLPGVFLTMAILAVLACPTIRWASPGPTRRPLEAASNSTGAGSPLPAAASQARNIFMLLAVLLVLYIGHGGIWAYQERIGLSAGLTHEQVGPLLGSSMLIWGVAGSLLATWLGLSIGRIWPQVLSLGTSILAAGMLVFGSGAWIYGLSCALIAFSWFYGLPYQTGLLALFDPKGRANIAGDLVSTLGSALGPTCAALLLGVGGHTAIGWMAAACYGVCLGLVLSSIQELVRTHPDALTRRND
jgi:predicted MFS family arabinose efflux permease